MPTATTSDGRRRPTSSASPSRGPKTFTFPRIVTGLGLALAITLLIVGFQAARNPPPSKLNDRLVDQFIPTAGDTVLKQGTVGIDLKPGYTLLRFDIADTLIPDDQIDKIVGLDSFSFTPGAGKALSELPRPADGRVCASAQVLRIGDPESAAERKAWCFQVSA